MHIFKRVICLVLCVAMLISCVGCTRPSDTPVQDSVPSSQPPQDTVPPEPLWAVMWYVQGDGFEQALDILSSLQGVTGFTVLLGGSDTDERYLFADGQLKKLTGQGDNSPEEFLALGKSTLTQPRLALLYQGNEGDYTAEELSDALAAAFGENAQNPPLALLVPDIGNSDQNGSGSVFGKLAQYLAVRKDDNQAVSPDYPAWLLALEADPEMDPVNFGYALKDANGNLLVKVIIPGNDSDPVPVPTPGQDPTNATPASAGSGSGSGSGTVPGGTTPGGTGGTIVTSGYEVTYHALGQKQAIRYAKNTLLSTLPAPAQPNGKVFLGWYHDSAFTERIDPQDKLTGNIALYAKFTDAAATEETGAPNFLSAVGQPRSFSIKLNAGSLPVSTRDFVLRNLSSATTVSETPTAALGAESVSVSGSGGVWTLQSASGGFIAGNTYQLELVNDAVTFDDSNAAFADFAPSGNGLSR